jgi:Sulfotransferase domain.
MSEDQVHQLADHLSFANMKSNPSVNLEVFARIERERHGLPENQDLHFLRQGQTGGWRKDMPQAVADRLDAWTELRLRGTDYDPQARGKINTLEQVL